MENGWTRALILVFFLGAFLVLPVGGAIVQMYRDARGAKRNRDHRCYACNGIGALYPVRHYRSHVYLYCSRCRERQGNWSRLVIGTALLLVVGAGLSWLLLQVL